MKWFIQISFLLVFLSYGIRSDPTKSEIVTKAKFELDDPKAKLSADTVDLIVGIITNGSIYHPQRTSLIYHNKTAGKSCQSIDVQVLYGENGHWVCTYHYPGSNIFVYDSGYRKNWINKLSDNQKAVLQQIYPFLEKNFFKKNVVFKQPKLLTSDNAAHGVFALYYMKIIILDSSLPEQSVGNIDKKIYENNAELVKHLRASLKELVVEYDVSTVSDHNPFRAYEAPVVSYVPSRSRSFYVSSGLRSYGFGKTSHANDFGFSEYFSKNHDNDNPDSHHPDVEVPDLPETKETLAKKLKTAVHELKNYKELTDTTVDFIANIYAKQSTYKPQSTLVCYGHAVTAKPCKPDQNDVQILFGESYHWICTFYKAKHGKIYVYDSLYHAESELSDIQKSVLKKFYPFIEKEKFDQHVVFLPPKLTQSDVVSCGVFALFYMKLIMDGYEPEKSVGNIDEKIYERYPVLVGHLRKNLIELVSKQSI